MSTITSLKADITNIIIDNFLNDLNKIHTMDKYLNSKIPTDLEIQHVNSELNNGIQAVDIVAGAIHKRYRDKDHRYYDIFKNRIEISNHVNQFF